MTIPTPRQLQQGRFWRKYLRLSLIETFPHVVRLSSERKSNENNEMPCRIYGVCPAGVERGEYKCEE